MSTQNLQNVTLFGNKVFEDALGKDEVILELGLTNKDLTRKVTQRHRYTEDHVGARD